MRQFAGRSVLIAAALLLQVGCNCGDDFDPDSGIPLLHVDAGTHDAGAADSGTHDAGSLDAGPIDAGVTDAGTIDSGIPDSGAPDAGSVDSGTIDSGTPDAGISDAGAPDAGEIDAGFDAGMPLTCAQWVVIVELDGGGMGMAHSADDGGELPGFAPDSCSIDGTTHSEIDVTNNAPCGLEMWWVNYQCNEELYGFVDPNGGAWNNNTFVTHPWRIRIAGTHQLVREITPAVDATTRQFIYP